MDLLRFFTTLVAGTLLGCIAAFEASRPEANTCPVVACAASGLPGRDGKDGMKGEKGDQGVGLKGQQGLPGKAGPPGPVGMKGTQSEKGQKGETAAIDAVQSQVTALENKLQALQAEHNKYKRVVHLQGFTVGQKTFFSTRKHDTFANGRALCAKAEAAMACPRNAAENSAVHELTKRDAQFAFLDINDMAREGTFVYPNGVPVSYTNWHQGEPNAATTAEDCATVLAENAKWNDYNCGHTALIICEF